MGKVAFCVLRFAFCVLILRFAFCVLVLHFAFCVLRFGFASCVLRFAFCILRFDAFCEKNYPKNHSCDNCNSFYLRISKTFFPPKNLQFRGL